jgi:catechol 2,3-dioxygenase-like lactoylglutathione lyase family enzyme
VSSSPQPHPRATLLVLCTDRLEECRAFYRILGLRFAREQHGTGPEHFAAVLPDGTVFELYPATGRHRTSDVRLGFAVDGDGLELPLPPGRHRLTDPDGRIVEVHVR